MPVGAMQDEGGVLFLWVTGRAMELGRECLKAWGCVRVLLSLSLTWADRRFYADTNG